MDRAVIWDVDGTMVDTAELHYQAWTQLAEELGKPLSREGFLATFGRRNPDIIHELFGEQFTDAKVAELGARKEHFYRVAARQRGVTLLPGVQPLLEALPATGFKQGIGSSAPRENLELILELTATAKYFDALVSMEDTSRGKPDPQVFLVAAKKLSIAPERCLVIEDAVAGVQAAKAAGMKCVAVRTVGHHSKAVLRGAGADLVVDSLEQVTVRRVRALVT